MTALAPTTISSRRVVGTPLEKCWQTRLWPQVDVFMVRRACLLYRQWTHTHTHTHTWCILLCFAYQKRRQCHFLILLCFSSWSRKCSLPGLWDATLMIMTHVIQRQVCHACQRQRDATVMTDVIRLHVCHACQRQGDATVMTDVIQLHVCHACQRQWDATVMTDVIRLQVCHACQRLGDATVMTDVIQLHVCHSCQQQWVNQEREIYFINVLSACSVLDMF